MSSTPPITSSTPFIVTHDPLSLENGVAALSPLGGEEDPSEFGPAADNAASTVVGLVATGEQSCVPADGLTVGPDDNAVGFDAGTNNGDPAVAGSAVTSTADNRLPRGEVVYLPPADDAFIDGVAVWAPNPLDRIVVGAGGFGRASPGTEAPQPPQALPARVEIFCREAAAVLAQPERAGLWRRWAQEQPSLLDRGGFKVAAKQRRQDLGLSAHRVGELLGVSGNMVYCHEWPNHPRWQADVVQRLGWLYCLRADWLVHKGIPIADGPATWREIVGRAAVLGWDARTFKSRLGQSLHQLRADLAQGSALPAGVWEGVTEILRARVWPAPRGEFGEVLVDHAQLTGFAQFLLGAWHMSYAEMASWLLSRGYAVNADAVERAMAGTVSATAITPSASQSFAVGLGFRFCRPQDIPRVPPQFYDREFVACLEGRRLARRWSLAKLAERAGVNVKNLARLLRFQGEALSDEFGELAWRLINLTAQTLDVPLYDLDSLPRTTFTAACERWLADAADTPMVRRKTGCVAHDAVALVRALRRALFLAPTTLAERLSAKEAVGISWKSIVALEARLIDPADGWHLDDRERIQVRKLLKCCAVDVDPKVLLPRVVVPADSDRAAVGQALRQAFARSLYTKGELVARAHICKTILARILKGEYAASNPALRRVAGCLNVVLPAPVLLATKPRRGTPPEPVWVEGLTQWRETLRTRLSQLRLGRIRLGRKFGWTVAEWQTFRRGTMPLTHPRLVTLALTLRVYGRDLSQVMLDQCNGDAAAAIRRYRLPPDAFNGPFYRLPALTDGALVATLARRGRLLGLQSAARLGLESRNLDAYELGLLADSGGDLGALLGADSGLVHALLRRGDAVSAALYLLNGPALLSGEEGWEKRMLRFLDDHKRWRRQVYGEDAVGSSEAEALRAALTKGLEGG